MVQDAKQRCEIKFPETLLPSDHAIEIVISYQGKIDDDLSGFFRFQEPSKEGDRYVASTQFQPSDARRAFPCFDEPALKATFDLSIEVESGQQVISNMPVQKTEPSPKKAGRNIVHFERTPVMSTYLLAWAMGRFEHLETTISRRDAQNLPIRVYFPPGQENDAHFALNLASRTIQYFSEIFDINYPLPKLDLISLLELSDDAMENWGLVIFRSTALLLNPTTCDLATKTRAAYIIAHELAHQWFGNLVTMSWWDDLWLNEGFATWAGWRACEEFYPEWDVWGMFLVDDLQEALDLDSLGSSHPVHVPVMDGLEVDSIFDTISYLKGAAVVRMLVAQIGEERFLKGVGEYLRANMYWNCTADDLWGHLSAASGQDVGALMKPWVDRQGFPIVDVKESETGTILVSQDAKDSSWPIPISVQTSTGLRHDLLGMETIEYEADAQINVDQIGFYRIRYSQPYLQKLITNVDNISPHAQAGLLCNAASLAWTGGDTLSTADMLQLLDRFSNSSNAIVWDGLSSVLSRINSIFADDDEISDLLDRFTLQLAEPVLERIGWSFLPNDNHNTNRLRVLLFELVGLSGNPKAVQQACDSTKQWLQGDEEAIHPFLILPTLEIAVNHLGAEIVDQLWDVYEETESPILRDHIATAFGQIQDPKTARECLKRAFAPDEDDEDDEEDVEGMMTQDIETLACCMADDSSGRETLWQFFVDEWDSVEEEMGGSMAIFNPFITETLRCFATEESHQRIVNFFAEKTTTGYRRGLAVALDFVSANASYRSRDIEGVRQWLRRRFET